MARFVSPIGLKSDRAGGQKEDEGLGSHPLYLRARSSLGEQGVCNAQVTGSNPVLSTCMNSSTDEKGDSPDNRGFRQMPRTTTFFTSKEDTMQNFLWTHVLSSLVAEWREGNTPITREDLLKATRQQWFWGEELTPGTKRVVEAAIDQLATESYDCVHAVVDGGEVFDISHNLSYRAQWDWGCWGSLIDKLENPEYWLKVKDNGGVPCVFNTDAGRFYTTLSRWFMWQLGGSPSETPSSSFDRWPPYDYLNYEAFRDAWLAWKNAELDRIERSKRVMQIV